MNSCFSHFATENSVWTTHVPKHMLLKEQPLRIMYIVSSPIIISLLPCVERGKSRDNDKREEWDLQIKPPY